MADDRLTERADLLAYFARKRANAFLVAKRSPDFAERAEWIARQITVFEQDLAAGLHIGDAETALDSEGVEP